jgi:hypothetical protein
MANQDYRDIFVLLMVSAGWVAATVFLFLYHSTANFGIWAGLVGTIGGVYHWICVSDDKRVDAGNVATTFDVGELAKAAMDRDWKGEDHG